ncbi:MAG TPA: aspartyl-phosphate phosphatase Spo0E family protein [Bacillota bacterium]
MKRVAPGPPALGVSWDRPRKDVVPISEGGDLRDRIEALRRELYRLYENGADRDDLLAVSRQLDALIVRLIGSNDSDAPGGDDHRKISGR